MNDNQDKKNRIKANRCFNLYIKEEDKDKRIDKFISDQLEDYTRSYIQKLIKEDLVFVNDHNVKANYKLSTDDHILIKMPPPQVIEVIAENIPLNIIYEDDEIIIINKEKGMVVHPANGHYTGTLVNALLYHYKDQLSSIGGKLRPGIVHRLDMDTTGVLIVCKNDESHIKIARQLKNQTVTRKYNAIVYNAFNKEEGTIDAPIGRHPINRKRMSINHDNGKEAVTHYKLIDNLSDNLAHVECSLETGRTHQIRVHMASILHPLVGDEVYGHKNKKKKFNTSGQALHARLVGFIHPTSNEYIEFEAPLPDYFIKLLNKYKKN